MIEIISGCQQLKLLLNNLEIAATFGTPLSEVPGVNEFLDLATDLDGLIQNEINPPLPSLNRGSR